MIPASAAEIQPNEGVQRSHRSVGSIPLVRINGAASAEARWLSAYGTTSNIAA
jgi:hypothetical protein